MGYWSSSSDLLRSAGLSDVSSQIQTAASSILENLNDNGVLRASNLHGFPKPEDKVKVAYLSALVQQNWIIIRQLDRLNSLLEKK